MLGSRGLVSVRRSAWSSCGGLWRTMTGLVHPLTLTPEAKSASGWRGSEWRGPVPKLVPQCVSLHLLRFSSYPHSLCFAVGCSLLSRILLLNLHRALHRHQLQPAFIQRQLA